MTPEEMLSKLVRLNDVYHVAVKDLNAWFHRYYDYIEDQNRKYEACKEWQRIVEKLEADMKP